MISRGILNVSEVGGIIEGRELQVFWDVMYGPLQSADKAGVHAVQQEECGGCMEGCEAAGSTLPDTGGFLVYTAN